MKTNIDKFMWIKVLLHYLVICFLIKIFDFYFMNILNCSNYILNSNFIQLVLTEDIRWIYIEITPMIIPIVVVLAYCHFILNKSVGTLGFKKKRGVIFELKGIGLGGILFSFCMIAVILSGSVKFDGISNTADFGLLIVYFAGFLIQGLEEELLYRGFLFGQLNEKTQTWIAVLISSIVFSWSHHNNVGFSFLPFFNLFVWGLITALLYIKSKNIWLVAGFHSAWNFAQGNIWGISVSGNDFDCTLFESIAVTDKNIFNGGTFGIEGSIIVSLILVLFVIGWIMKNKDDIKKN